MAFLSQKTKLIMDHSTYLTGLEAAIDSNDSSEFSRLIQSATQSKVIDSTDLGSCLTVAIQKQRLSMVRLILDHGGVPQAKDAYAALDNSSPEALEALINHGLDVNDVGSRGWTLLHHAMKTPRHVETLLNHGADPQARNKTWKMTVLDSCAASSPLATLQLLLARGARLDGSNPLHAAAQSMENNRIPIMTYLIDQCHLDINAVSTVNQSVARFSSNIAGTPLQAAIKAGRKDHIEFLIDRGADPTISSNQDEDEDEDENADEEGNS